MISKIQGAAKAFIEATRGDVVPDDVIAARTRICRNCPLRVPATGTGRVSQVLGKLANENKVDKNISGYKCSVCGCALLLLLPAKEPHVDSDKERARRLKGNKGCWLLTL